MTTTPTASDILLAMDLYKADSDLTSYTNQATQVLCFTFIPQGLIGLFLGGIVPHFDYSFCFLLELSQIPRRTLIELSFMQCSYRGLEPYQVCFTGIRYLQARKDAKNVAFALLCFVGLGPVVVAFECVFTSLK